MKVGSLVECVRDVGNCLGRPCTPHNPRQGEIYTVAAVIRHGHDIHLEECWNSHPDWIGFTASYFRELAPLDLETLLSENTKTA